MEHLFNYTRQLSGSIYSLIEDIVVLQRILDEKKKSISTAEKIKITLKEIQRKTFFLRILEHISYLEDYKNDIKRAIESVDLFIKDKTYTNTEMKRIRSYLSTICKVYKEEEKTTALAAPNLQCLMIDKLEGTMKTVEEILLSHYGLTSPVVDLEEKLIKSIEALFNLPLEELLQEEKLLVEEFFTHIQNAFEAKGTDGWEDAYIKCTAVMNKLKESAGLPPNSNLEITIDEVDKDKESEE